MSLVGLLILIIVGGLIFGLAWMLINMIPALPPIFKTAALCVLILIAIIVLLDVSGILGGGIGCGTGLRLR